MALSLIFSRASTLFWRTPASISRVTSVFIKYIACILQICQQ